MKDQKYYRVSIECVEGDSVQASVRFEHPELAAAAAYALIAISPFVSRMEYELANIIDVFSEHCTEMGDCANELINSASAVIQHWDEYDELRNKGTVAE